MSKALTRLSNTKGISIHKGHQLLIALLLFICSSSTQGATPVKLDSITTTQLWLASQLLPGSGHIIHHQYWKAPLFYAGMGSMAYLGVQANRRYHAVMDEYDQPFYSPEEKYRFEEKWTQFRMQRNLFYVGAGVFYAASVADALMANTKGEHSPQTATVLSVLLPGLGQIYNHKPWKVPFVYGGIASVYYIVDFNQRGYKRAGTAIRDYPDNEFGTIRTMDDLIYLRDAYRRNRDLAIIGMAGFYLLNVIDAYVDAHLHYWDISDDLAFNLRPVIFNNTLAFRSKSGLSLGLHFNYNF